MTATPEQIWRIHHLGTLSDKYVYRGPSLHDKVLVALIGPTATGKSTLIQEILVQCRKRGIHAGETGTITTRARRIGSDPESYQTADEGITHATMIDLIERGQLTNWSLMPTGNLYGGTSDSLPAEYNFSPLMPDSLPMLRRAGFRAVHAIYIGVPPQQWAEQLPDRLQDPTFIRRIDEALDSLNYALDNSDDLHIVINHRNQLPQTAARIIDIITNNEPPVPDDLALQTINDMWVYALDLKEQLDAAA